MHPRSTLDEYGDPRHWSNNEKMDVCLAFILRKKLHNEFGEFVKDYALGQDRAIEQDELDYDEMKRLNTFNPYDIPGDEPPNNYGFVDEDQSW